MNIDDPEVKAFHEAYFNTHVHDRTTFLGVSVIKTPMDLWAYQEILTALRPALVVELGVKHGGFSFYCATLLAALKIKAKVLAVDISLANIDARAHAPQIEFMECDSADPGLVNVIDHLRAAQSGPMFAILDSDHRAAHVLAELEMLREATRPGDYVVVEDTNIGHYARFGYGPGPMEGLRAYLAAHPHDYVLDLERQNKFGLTYAPGGFLKRV